MITTHHFLTRTILVFNNLATEREVLVDAVIPATQRHSVVLMWMIRLFIEGRASGHIQGGHGFESETMHKFHIIRSQYGAIGDELQGRMPLAYAHIVQVGPTLL